MKIFLSEAGIMIIESNMIHSFILRFQPYILKNTYRYLKRKS